MVVTNNIMEYIYRLYRLVAGLGSRFHGFEVSQEITNKLWLFLWPKKKSFQLLKISRIIYPRPPNTHKYKATQVIINCLIAGNR